MFGDKIINGLSGLAKKISGALEPKTDLNSRVERYVNLEGVSTEKLNLGLWYVKHQKLMFLALVWLLVAVSAILWSYSLYYLTSFLLVGLRQDRENLLSLTTTSFERIQADYEVNFKVEPAKVLSSGEGRYDLTAKVTNNNDNVWVHFDYYFYVNGQVIGRGRGFAFPHEEKFVMALNQPLAVPALEAKLVIENDLWAKINRHNIPDWQQFRDSHLDFLVRDKIFVSAVQSGLTESLFVNQLSFNITNQTPYNYRRLPLDIILYSGNQVVGVNQYFVNDFTPRQKVEASMNIIGNLPPVDRIEVLPNINLLSPDIYGPIK